MWIDLVNPWNKKISNALNQAKIHYILYAKERQKNKGMENGNKISSAILMAQIIEFKLKRHWMWRSTHCKIKAAGAHDVSVTTLRRQKAQEMQGETKIHEQSHPWTCQS